QEVEAALAAHPALAACAVMALPEGPPEGGGGALLAPAVVLPPGPAAPAAGELRRFLAARLPEPMLPGRFAVLPVLPLTPHGKVDRRDLEGELGQGPPR